MLFSAKVLQFCNCSNIIVILHDILDIRKSWRGIGSLLRVTEATVIAAFADRTPDPTFNENKLVCSDSLH